MSTDPVTGCLQLLEALQEEVLDGDPRAFGDGHNAEEVREVVEAWETVNALSDLFLQIIRGTHGVTRL